MKQNQKGSSNIFIVVALIVVVAVVGFYLLKGKSSTYQTSQQTGTTQAIQSDSDLTNASQELNNTNIDGTIDPELNQNTSDAQTF